LNKILVILILVLVFLIYKSGTHETQPNLNISISSIEIPSNWLTASTYPVTLATLPSGRQIQLYKFGEGSITLLIVGNIHGGYESNAYLITENILSAFSNGEIIIPENVSIYVIPTMNPDGLSNGQSLAGRFNGQGVDLNRNWDYEWKSSVIFHGESVKAGSAPFSEIETQTVGALALQLKPTVTVFFHCCWGMGTTFANDLANDAGTALANGSGYQLLTGLSGENGEARDWFQIQGLPAIEHEFPAWTESLDTDWANNLPGLIALLDWISQ